MIVFESFIFIVFFLCSNALNSSKVMVDLEFIVPGANPQTISTKLAMKSPQLGFNVIRSILYLNKIIMDCTFKFDTNAFIKNKALICDVNSACVSSSNSHNKLLHFANIGNGDLEIYQIKKQNKILFYGLMHVERYIDFKLHDSTMHPMISQMHPKNIICSQTINNNNNNTSKNPLRKLLTTNLYNDEIYGDINYYKDMKLIQHNGHTQYMDIILTVIFLILVVISVFNMSYAANHIKRNSFDTRRV